MLQVPKGSPDSVPHTASSVPWDQMTLGQALDRFIHRWGDRDFVIFPHRRFTARQFADEVDRLARGLARLGLKPGEHVAIWLPNLPEVCVLEFAIARLGAVMMAANIHYKSSELEYVLRQSDATTLVVMPRFGKIDFLKTLHQILPEMATCRPGALTCAAAPELKRVLVLGDEQPGMIPFAEVLRLGDDLTLAGDVARYEAQVGPADVVLLQSTSGTTRFPKAVMLAHGQVLRNAAQMAARAGIDDTDRVMSAMPMFHVGGSVAALLGTVTSGAPLYLSSAFDPAETLDTIEKESITAYIGLESMFIALRHHDNFNRRSRASLCKGWTAGTSSLLRMVAEEIGIRNICSLFGLSECSPNVTIADWRDPYEKRLNTMGRPQPGAQVKIASIETGQDVPVGQVGEILVRGYLVMRGFYKDPEATAAAIDDEGWLHTGDLGRFDEDGYLTWVGRAKDTLRVGGENISAVEVENLIAGHACVQAAVVVGVPDDRFGEVVFAFVKQRPGRSVTERELIEFCRERVSGFKVPRYVSFVNEFEMTGSGKIQKFLMRKTALDDVANRKINETAASS